MRIAAVFLAFFIGTSAGAQSQLRELLDAKYRGNRALSKLTLTFDQQIRFSQRHIGANQIRLTFPNTASEKYATRIPVIFKSGHAKSLAFDFRRADTVALILTLHDNVAFDVRRPQGKPVIEIDMYDKEAAIAQAPVDLASVVKQQIDEANATEQAKKAPPLTMSFFRIQVKPFLAALLLSLFGTAGLMYWIVKPRPPARPAPARTAPPAKNTATSSVDAILDQARVILHERSTQAQGAVSKHEDEDATTSLAKAFGRGRGELQFARTMENREFMWEKKLQSVDVQRRDSIARAKKLGVGRGELELAASLKRVSEEQLRKEPVT